jgi:hypothetical protein
MSADTREGNEGLRKREVLTQSRKDANRVAHPSRYSMATKLAAHAFPTHQILA